MFLTAIVHHSHDKMAQNSIPNQMQAQILEAFNTPYSFKTVSVPKISSEHDILLKVDAAGYVVISTLMLFRSISEL